MNTGKQINAMVVVLFVLLVAVGAYSVWDPFRADTKKDRQEELSVERAANTFALNCRLCHGDRGEGGVAGGRLPAALPLNGDRLQGIMSGAFDQVLYEESFKLVTNTIMCGRVGTFMPTWGQSQGGPLSDEQIRQLAVLITLGRWDAAQEHADELDAETTSHATVQMPGGSLGADETELIVNNAAPFTLGQYVRIQDERLRVLPKELKVERGIDGTVATDHDLGTELTVVVGAAAGTEQETPPTVTEPAKADVDVLVVSDTKLFAVGDTVQLGDERVRVSDILTGLPSTGQFVVEDFGRTPRRFLVSGASGIGVGDVVRVDGELVEVKAIRDDGDPGIELDADLSASADRISVSEPTFLAEGYVVRVGDELIEFGEPVDTEQTLAETLGRAQTTLTVSGTAGIRTGMVIRIGPELMEVTEIVGPARVQLERGAEDAEGNATQAASHGAGTAIVEVIEATEQGQPPLEEDTAQTLLEALDADGTSVAVSATTGLVVGGTYRLGGELVRVTDVQSARIRVERAVEGTKRAEHSRRLSIFDGNLFEVTRGVEGTSPAAHDRGEKLFFTELEVKRAVQGSKVEDHQKDDEIYRGHLLIVERGVLDTEPADHPNGELVRNFVTAPDNPTFNEAACGQLAVEAPPAETPGGPTPTLPAGGQEVAVSLDEFSVAADPASIADGPVIFQVTNDGSIRHNFRLIATELAPEALPLDQSGQAVDETQVDVVGGFVAAIPAGGSQTAAAELPPGAYVLICNVPTHYEAGMRVGFDVTAP